MRMSFNLIKSIAIITFYECPYLGLGGGGVGALYFWSSGIFVLGQST